MNVIYLKIVLFFSLFAIGCSPVYYAPTLMNVPNFKEKGEVYMAAHLASYGRSIGGDVQAAYAITKHIGIQANYMACTNKDKRETRPTSTTKGNLRELAIGYFGLVDETFSWSLYSGYGLGEVNNDWTNKGKSSANFSKLFIQPSMAANFNNVELIGSFKLANLKYNNLSNEYTDNQFINQFDALKNPIPIIECAGIMRVGIKNIKLQMQVGIMGLLKPVPDFQYEKVSIGSGACLQLNRKRDF